MKYNIQGDSTPVVICELAAGESMITESGSMVWMSPNMEMQTSGGGSLGKAFGRMFSGENIFQNIYTAKGGPGLIAFASLQTEPVHLGAKSEKCAQKESPSFIGN